MNKECDIVKDLIPLYADNLLSESSVELVNAHCSLCEACKNELEQACDSIRHNAQKTQSQEDKWAEIAKRARRRKTVDRVAIIIACMISVLIITLCLRACNWVINGNTVDKYDEKTYSQMAEKDNVMPKKTELGKYESVRYKYHHYDGMLSDSNAYTVLAKYKTDEYKKQKQEILKIYKFRARKVDNSLNDAPEQKKLKPGFNIGNFEFKLLSEAYGDDYYTFPKLVYLIGFNDTSSQIAFVKFKDFDIDFIYSYDTFMRQDCGWEWS